MTLKTEKNTYHAKSALELLERVKEERWDAVPGESVEEYLKKLAETYERANGQPLKIYGETPEARALCALLELAAAGAWLFCPVAMETKTKSIDSDGNTWTKLEV